MRPNAIFSKDQLCDRLFSYAESVSDNAIEVYVGRLRKKLEGSAARIETVRGLGYRLTEDERAPVSLRRRLVVQLVGVAAVLAVVVFLPCAPWPIRRLRRARRDFGGGDPSIAERLRGGDDGIEVDLAYATFSMLGAIGQDRVFYRIDAGGRNGDGL